MNNLILASWIAIMFQLVMVAMQVYTNHSVFFVMNLVFFVICIFFHICNYYSERG